MNQEIVQILVICLAVIAIVLYLSRTRIENFNVNPTEAQTTPTCQPQNQAIRSIISKYIGISVEVSPANSLTIGTLEDDYLVYVKKGNVSQSIKVHPDGKFSLTLPNGLDKSQLWKISKISNAQDLMNFGIVAHNSTEYPFHIVISQNSLKHLALHYENGTLAVRPLGDYEAQKWDVSLQPPLVGGIPIIDGGTESGMFPSEFSNMGASAGGVVLNGTNGQQDLLKNLTNSMNSYVSKDIKEVLAFLKAQNKTEAPSETLFGDKFKDKFKINVNLSKGSSLANVMSSPVETFTDSKDDINNLLAKYENNASGDLKNAELQQLISGNKICDAPNMDEYVHKDVLASCNACAL
jgi:hypothetical protein